MSAESPTGSRPASEAVRSLCISRSESTITPKASARGSSGPRTRTSFLETQRRVCGIRHLLTPSQHKAQIQTRGTSAWRATLNVVEVGFDDEPEAFSNINTREDLYSWKDAPPA